MRKISTFTPLAEELAELVERYGITHIGLGIQKILLLESWNGLRETKINTANIVKDIKKTILMLIGKLRKNTDKIIQTRSGNGTIVKEH